MDIETLLKSVAPGQGLGLDTLPLDGAEGLRQPPRGNTGQAMNASAIDYGQVGLGTLYYDQAPGALPSYIEKAISPSATPGDLLAMFETFQAQAQELLAKVLRVLGLSGQEAPELNEGGDSGQAQPSLEHLQVSAFTGERGAIPSNGGGAPTEGGEPQQPAIPNPSPTQPTEAAAEGEPATGGSGLHLPTALEPYRGAIVEAASESGMPADIIAGMIWAESRGDLAAQTTNGGNGLSDAGLMQINSNTFADLKARHPDLLGDARVNDASDNILAGALYLREQYDAFGGNMGAALRAYNSGPGNVNVSDLSDISKTGTGDPNYVGYVTAYAHTIATGEGELPA